MSTQTETRFRVSGHSDKATLNTIDDIGGYDVVDIAQAPTLYNVADLKEKTAYVLDFSYYQGHFENAGKKTETDSSVQLTIHRLKEDSDDVERIEENHPEFTTILETMKTVVDGASPKNKKAGELVKAIEHYEENRNREPEPVKSGIISTTPLINEISRQASEETDKTAHITNLLYGNFRIPEMKR